MDTKILIACNYKGKRLFRKGAKLILEIPNGGVLRYLFSGLSIGGRRIRAYAALKDCYNFRIVSGNPKSTVGFKYSSREDAEKFVFNLNTILGNKA